MNTLATTNLNLETVRPRLRRLGFYGLLAHAETLLNEPWLARVIDLEERERSHRSLKRRLDQARLGRFKPIADFDWTWPTKCDRGLIEELFSLAFIEEAANVVFFGSNGLGKTMLFKNLAHQACCTATAPATSSPPTCSTTSPHKTRVPHSLVASAAIPVPPYWRSTRLATFLRRPLRRSAVRGRHPPL